MKARNHVTLTRNILYLIHRERSFALSFCFRTHSPPSQVSFTRLFKSPAPLSLFSFLSHTTIIILFLSLATFRSDHGFNDGLVVLVLQMCTLRHRFTSQRRRRTKPRQLHHVSSLRRWVCRRDPIQLRQPSEP